MIESDPYDPMNNTYQCRICLEDDSEEKMIYPCKCSGTSKYVHKTCLNEWRTTSENSDNFDRCELCKYEYRFEPNNTNYVFCCSNRYKQLIRQPILFYTLYFLLCLGLGELIAYCDNYRIKSNNIEDTSPIYFVISTSILVCLQIITILYWFIKVKNKKLYCKLYSSKKEIIVGSIVIAIFSGIIFGWLLGIFLLEFCAFRMFQVHFYSIDKLSIENQLNILNYDPDNEYVYPENSENPLSSESNV